MSRRLRGGLTRLFRDHRSALAVRYRREYAAILAALAINGDALLQREAGRVAMLRVRALTSAAAWGSLVEKRAAGRGRKPNARAVERAARRAHLDDMSATQALDRLRALAGERRNGSGDPLADVRRAVAEANRARRR